MKNGKIPYGSAELEVIRFTVADVLTSSNTDHGGADWNKPSIDDWANGNGDEW